MTFNNYVETFGGMPIKEHQPGDAITDSNVAWRVAIGGDLYYGDEYGKIVPGDYYANFFNVDGLNKIQTLVFGCWNFEGDGDVSQIVNPLVKNADKFPNLRTLFLGDIISEDCEVSWLEMSNISKLWAAFPQLEVFWIRGGENLSFGKIEHANLKELVVQSGGLPKSVVNEVLNASLPNLEHLELWLGDEGYGADTSVDDFKSLLDGSLFPKLKYLGLCNSQYTDELAKGLATSAIIDRIETLDLSSGTLGDEGAEALLASGKLDNLKKLDVHHHYLSDEYMAKLKALPCEVNVDEQEDAEDNDGDRYVAVSE